MRRITLFVMFLVGVVLLVPALLGANWMGQRWTSSPDAATPWWLSPSVSVTAKTAYRFFAVGLLMLGGVLGGCAAAAMLKDRRRSALFLMLGAIVAAGVGFNTFDWMVSYLVGSPGHLVTFTLWNFGLPNVPIDGWNFYIFAMLIPLWLGSFLVSLSILYGLIRSQK
jgi:hypothetical protein